MKVRMAMLLLWGALSTGPALAGDPAAQCYPPAANALPSAGAMPASTSCDEQSGGFGADGTDVELDSEYLLCFGLFSRAGTWSADEMRHGTER